MKRQWQRFAVLAFAILLALSMGLTALAADTQALTPTNTATPTDGPAVATGTDRDESAPSIEGEAPVPGSDGSQQTEEETQAPEPDTSGEPEPSPQPIYVEPDEPAGEEPEIAAAGRELDAASVVVTTYDELKRALGEDNGYTLIYLGADITADGTGAPIHKSKPFVIIDGSPPDGGRYTLTQYRVDNTTSLLLVTDTTTATREVTLRHIDIVGRNHYGVVWVADSLTSVVQTFEDVNYTGPQPVNHRTGAVRFVGGSYTLVAVGGLGVGEFAEARAVELGGALTVSASGTSNGLLWLVGSGTTLTVLEGADVTIDTNYYLVYGNPDVTMQAGASLRLTSKRFGFTYADNSVGTFIMEAGAQLHIDLNTVESYAALRVSKSFEMKPGGALTIVRTGTRGIALRLTGVNAQAMFDRPDRVFLYSSAGVPLRFTGAGTLSITTGALNAWQSVGWPLVGGIETQPTHVWNRASGALSVTGSYYNEINQKLTHNLAAGDPTVSALDSKTFNLESNQLIAFGDLSLTLDTVTDRSTALTGGTSPGAQVRADYLLPTGAGQVSGAADGGGRYTLPVERGLTPGSGVTATARSRDLFARAAATVQETDGGRLALTAVPGSIDFGARPVPDAPSIAERAQSLHIAVEDTRPGQTPWRIDVSLSQPLTGRTDNGTHTLFDAVVFRTSDGRTLTLSDMPDTVHRSDGGNADIAWSSDEGVLLRLLPGDVYSDTAYSATIQWTLVDAP